MQRRFESDPQFQATLLLLQERMPKSAALFTHPTELSAIARRGRRSRGAGARAHAPRHADARSAAAVQRPLPRDGHQRRRRQQPLEGPRRHALARGPARATTGARSATSATSPPASSGRPPPAHAQARSALRGDLHRGARRVPPLRQRLRVAHGDRRLAGGRHRAAPPAHHQPLARPRARSTSPATRRSCWRRPPPTRCIRRSRNLFVQTRDRRPRRRPSCARAGRARSTSAPPWMFHLMAVHGAESLGVSYETDRMAFIGRGRTAASPQAMTERGRASRRPGLGARPDRRDPPSASRWSRSRPSSSTSPRAWPTRATPRWRWSTSTRIATSPTACSTSRGRIAG